MANESDNKWIGKRTIRPDGEDKVTGRANFGADFAQPHMLWGKILRSPHPHARIKSINLERAAAAEGVRAVMCGDDLVHFPVDIPAPAGPQDLRYVSRNVMARDKALYAGHAVAAVAATSARAAEAALDLIDVQYEVLPWVIDVEEAMQPDAPLLHDFMYTQGVDPQPSTSFQHLQSVRVDPRRRGRRISRKRTSSSSGTSRPSPSTKATSNLTPAWSTYLPAVRPPSGVRARASSWCAT